MSTISNKIKMGLGVALIAVSAIGVVLPVAAAPCTAGMSAAECAQQGATGVDPDEGSVDLNTVIQTIINTIIFAIGIVAVFMVILGGIQYTTSQGDAGKVKKAKDTIMYGVIGLVVSLLAFAIVNFVLSSVF